MLSESLSGAACSQGRLCFLGFFRLSLGFAEAELRDGILPTFNSQPSLLAKYWGQTD